MKYTNKGYDIENRIKIWFKGTNHASGSVDFLTKKALYEVKSCKLFHKYYNSNHKRSGNSKGVESHHLGRFSVNVGNHFSLKSNADYEKKVAKYVFVLLIGKQIVYRVVDWKELLVDPNSDVINVRIKDVFNEDLA